MGRIKRRQEPGIGSQRRIDHISRILRQQVQIYPDKFTGTVACHISVGMSFDRIRNSGIIIQIRLIKNKIIDQCFVRRIHGIVILHKDADSPVIDHTAG